jgi:hypothetical protein
MVGIGLTTYGNRETPALEMIRKNSKGTKIVTVDMYGIAQAKNMCISLLEDCEHIFLIDDDTYGICKDWYLPYIESGIKHLSYTFNRNVLGFYNQCTIYEKPSGCMLYIHRDCIHAVGGFDTEYNLYAGEHEDFSRRIFNAGLTPYPYMDLITSSCLIHSMDEHKQVVSSVPGSERARVIQGNMRRVVEQANSKEFKPYK